MDNLIEQMRDFYTIYNVYKKGHKSNDTVRYNHKEKWLTFYHKGLAVTRKVYKYNDTYFIKFNNYFYKLPVYILNEKLTQSRNPIIEF